ncbi:MAG: 3D domain-containing protein [Clostridium sp.]
MVEKFKQNLKESFSKGPKAKIMLGLLITGMILTTTVVIMRKTITVSIDGEEKIFVTYSSTVEGALQDQAIELEDKDKISPTLDTKLTEDQTILIKKAVPVDITIGNNKLVIKTAEKSIGDMLKAEEEFLREQGISFNLEYDEITPSIETTVQADLVVNVVNVEVKDIVESKTLEFSTVTEKDSSLHYTYEKVKNEGQNGEKEVTYEVIYKNGKEFTRKQKSEKILVSPVNKVIVKGTMQTFNRGGIDIPFKKRLICESTAYSGHGTTATGRKPVYNPGGISTIAVDPRVIPLGSKVYVEGYGYAIAADTGGAIKGNIVDVFLNSSEACRSWGRKKGVEVYIIAYPGEW